MLIANFRGVHHEMLPPPPPVGDHLAEPIAVSKLQLQIVGKLAKTTPIVPNSEMTYMELAPRHPLQDRNGCSLFHEVFFTVWTLFYNI
jgi:hypothetical protein